MDRLVCHEHGLQIGYLRNVNGMLVCPHCPPVVPAPGGEPLDATTAILAERGARYGKFAKHASVTQDIKRALFDCRHRESLAPDQVEALEMIAHKLGRIVNGDPDYADSWADIAGYARLVADRLEGVER